MLGTAIFAIAASGASALPGCGEGCPGPGAGETSGTTAIKVVPAQKEGLPPPASLSVWHLQDNGESGNQIDCGPDCEASWPWTCTASECESTTVPITATATGGWKFDHWSASCDGNGEAANVCLEHACCNALRTVTAYFADVEAPKVEVTGNPPTATNKPFDLIAHLSDNDTVKEAYWYSPMAGSRFADQPVKEPGPTLSKKVEEFQGAYGLYLGVEFGEAIVLVFRGSTLGVKAIDFEGNSATGEVTLNIDTEVTPPHFTSPAPNSLYPTATVPVAWEEPDADVPSENVLCKVDGRSWKPCTTRTSWIPQDLPDGARTVSISLTDKLGNESVNSIVFRVDATAPSGRFGPGTGEGETTSVPYFTFSIDGTGSAATATCAVDSREPTPCWEDFAPLGLGDGPHTLVIHMTDEAGHTADLVRHFTVGNSTAVTPFGPPPAAKPRVEAKLKAAWRLSRGKTIVKKLRLEALPIGADIVVRCTGRGCFRKRRVLAPAGRSADLSRLFKQPLGPGATITIDVTVPQMRAEQFRYVTLRHRKPALTLSTPPKSVWETSAP